MVRFIKWLGCGFLVLTGLLVGGFYLGTQLTTLPFAPDPAKPHHSEVGFLNNYRQRESGAHTTSFLKWQLESPWWSWQPIEMPKADNDPAFLKANRSESTLTWIGHATFLLQVAGTNILTDAHFSERASPLSFIGPERLTPLGLEFNDLPTIDYVVISHNHYDHLDVKTVQLLHERDDPLFIVPLGLKAWFNEQGVKNVQELDWWEATEFKGWQITAVPDQHFSARTPWNRNHTLWAGWVMEMAGQKFYFAGDTGYSADFAEIGRRFASIDLAMIPIGAYEPRWFMQAMHVNPEEAVKIHQDVQARYSVGMHWGTFRLTDEPFDEPPKRLATAVKSAGIAADRFFVMQHGETRKLQNILSK